MAATPTSSNGATHAEPALDALRCECASPRDPDAIHASGCPWWQQLQKLRLTKPRPVSEAYASLFGEGCAPEPRHDAPLIPVTIPVTHRSGYVQYEPAPNPSAAPAVWDLIQKDIAERDEFGRLKYGTRLRPHNGRDFLVDLYQELLDAIVYARGALFEKYGK
jgi:hypothetical protein